MTKEACSEIVSVTGGIDASYLFAYDILEQEKSRCLY